MTQDCSFPSSIANENKYCGSKRFPKGIHITETGRVPGSGTEDVSGKERRSPAEEDSRPWGYLLVHNKQLEMFRKQMDTYNLSHPEAAHKCFVHYSYRYRPRNNGNGVVRQQVPTVSGLVFLQGWTKELQTFLHANHPLLHLTNDCSTGRPACIDHSVMRTFMEVIAAHPENVTFLREPFIKFAKEHVRLRVLTGLFKDMEGYVVRVDRDRQLVMEFGGYAVAIRGIHNEDFEVAE